MVCAREQEVSDMKNFMIGDMKGQNVLITGGLGFIGSNLAHHLVKLGAEVTILDSMFPQYGANFANIRGIEEKIKVVKGDIRKMELVKQNVVNKQVIFSCAAQVSHIDSMKDPYFDVDINCKGNLNVLEAVRRYNDQARIVYTGTRSQVGLMQYSPVDENHPEFPTDIYSVNKSAAEKYHLIYHASYGIFATSLRITNTYGPRAQIRHPGYGVVNYFIRLAIEGKTITVYEPGMQTRDVVYVDDVVDCLLLAALKKEANGQVFNVASGKSIPFIELVKLIVKAAGTGTYKLVPWPEERKAIEVGDVHISIEKAKKLLGWYPKTRLEDGLSETIKYFRANLVDYV